MLRDDGFARYAELLFLLDTGLRRYDDARYDGFGSVSQHGVAYAPV